MKITKTEQFILYSLGKWFEEANRKIKSGNLKVSISKSLFIELVIKANFAKKSALQKPGDA